MAEGIVGSDHPERLAGVVPCEDGCLVLGRARPPLVQQRQRQPQRAAEPAGGRAAVAVAAVSRSRRGLAEGLVRLRRGKEACWVDPLAESARYEQLLAEGFSA